MINKPHVLVSAVLAAMRLPGTNSTQAAVLAVLVAILAATSVALLLVLVQRYRMVKDIIRWLRIRRMGEPERPPIVLAHAQLERLVREIQSLATASELERRELLVQSSYLQTLLACLNDPVIILDPAGAPVLSNRRAVELLIAPADPDSQNTLREFAAQAPVLDITRIALRSQSPISRQVRLAVGSRPRVLQITAAPISPGVEPRGILLLLQDQTELLQNVQIKADFAANASHELRTPLASIRAAVETINEAGNNLNSVGVTVTGRPSRVTSCRASSMTIGPLLRICCPASAVAAFRRNTAAMRAIRTFIEKGLVT